MDEVPELLQQYTLVGRSRTVQHLDVLPQGAPGSAFDDLPHVLLSDHSGLKSWKVIPVALTGFIKVPLVLDVLGEVFHGQCRCRSRLHGSTVFAIEY